MLYEKFLDLLRLTFYASVAFTAITFMIKYTQAKDNIDDFNRYSADLSQYESVTGEQNFYYQLTVVLLLGYIFFSVIKPPSWHLVEGFFKKLEEIIGLTITDVSDSMKTEGTLGKPLSAVDVNF